MLCLQPLVPLPRLPLPLFRAQRALLFAGSQGTADAFSHGAGAGPATAEASCGHAPRRWLGHSHPVVGSCASCDDRVGEQLPPTTSLHGRGCLHGRGRDQQPGGGRKHWHFQVVTQRHQLRRIGQPDAEVHSPSK